MFVRFIALLPLAVLASASHLHARDQCTTGTISCCNSVQTLSQADSLLAAFDLAAVAADAGGLVGLTCTSITLIGTGSSCSASQQTVCCSNDQYNGLVNIGCSPINLSA